MNLKQNARLVDTLGSAIADGGQSLSIVPQLLRRVLDEGAWKEFETQMGTHVKYARFEDFVTTPPLNGLGTTVEIVKSIVSKDIETQKRLAKAIRDTHGGDRKSDDKIKNTVGVLDLKERGVSQLPLPEGEDKKPKKKKQDQYGQRILRLEKKAPELYAQVLAGEKTVYAAAIEAKIDHPTMTVTLDSPRSAASLVGKASPEFLAELRRLLNSQ